VAIATFLGTQEKFSLNTPVPFSTTLMTKVKAYKILRKQSTVVFQRYTENANKSRKHPNFDHFATNVRIETEVEQQPQGDIEQIFILTWHQFVQLLHDPGFTLRHQNSANQAHSAIINQKIATYNNDQ